MTYRSAVCTASGALHGVCLSAICAAVARDVAFGLACGMIAGLYFALLAVLHTRGIEAGPSRYPAGKVKAQRAATGPVVTTIHARRPGGGPVIRVDARRMATPGRP
ncbi:MAG TPA: hypothetical protein ENN81_11390 [Phycisphaerales bacterium]|nr:hypothetical protein [Phycisphaerales bacterium]